MLQRRSDTLSGDVHKVMSAAHLFSKEGRSYSFTALGISTHLEDLNKLRDILSRMEWRLATPRCSGVTPRCAARAAENIVSALASWCDGQIPLLERAGASGIPSLSRP